MALKMDDGQFELLSQALCEVSYHYSGAAGALDLLADGLRSGLFDAGDGRVANFCELLGVGIRHLDETHGEMLRHHAAVLREAKERAPIELANSQQGRTIL